VPSPRKQRSHRQRPVRSISNLTNGAAKLEVGEDGVVEGVEVVVVALDAGRLSVEDLGVGAALLEVSAARDP
jgi:hypothetical protein